MATANEISELAATLAQLARTIAERETEPAAPPARVLPERVMLTAEEAAEQLGIGRTLMFKLLRTGQIESVRIGRLRRVPVSAIRAYAARLVDATTANAA
ncbi:excisionase family DNA binding protein [Amycolatopsis bartoniae]|uniref:Excisionase n=1 Tax=Amycolatopsis bartoniae TaxID=941986 RepID=A0A8H9J1X6_9PSEU|nr:helix-turn-helix domain-containing protein [Amycolatopsis bartoniae]MBB2935087.1 excisionase family DNA binding protein [Amycolatopsis bartoniae]TVT02561.1 helix-turn-helix domain-containing protein [Amycolatopsis bartoniae]GHF74256.1 excisionase [Amycolatopsis bartoniae]